MDIERSLLSKVISDGSLAEVSDRRVTREWFRDLDAQRVWDTLIRYQADYGAVPTVAVMKAEHPDYRFIVAPEPIGYLLDQMARARKLLLIEQSMAAALQAHDNDDPDQAVKALAAALSQITREVPATRDLDLSESATAFLDHYAELKALQGRLRGIPTGFYSIDQATSGWQSGNLVVFTGIQKSGKSTAMLRSAMATNTFGKTPLFVGFEMSNIEQQERFAAFTARVSHERLRAGQLTTEEERRLTRAMRQQENMPSFFLSTDAMGSATVTALAAKVDQLRPDVLFLDGVYMMDDEFGEPKMSPQALSNIVQGLKSLAMNAGIPVVCTTQSLESKLGSKRRLTSYSVGYTSAFGQYCDALIGVEQTEEHNIQRLSAILGRNFRPMECYVRWDWEHGSFEELDGNPFEEPEDDRDFSPAASAGF